MNAKLVLLFGLSVGLAQACAVASGDDETNPSSAGDGDGDVDGDGDGDDNSGSGSSAGGTTGSGGNTNAGGATGGWDGLGCQEGDTISCADISFNPNPYGTATCDPEAGLGNGEFRIDECLPCNPGVTTQACVAIDDDAFTGGIALCDASDDNWDTSSCGVCGDDQTDEAEQCDGTSVTPTTCEALGLSEGPDPNASVDTCTDACVYDTSVCGNCVAGVQAEKCMESGEHCTGQQCDGAGCGLDQTCEFWCRDNASNVCDAPACSPGATCRFDCYNNGGCPNAACHAGAKCAFRCQNTGGHCPDVICEDGAECDFECQDGGMCSTVGTARCKSGQECTVGCTNGGDCAGVDLICEAGSICHLQMNGTQAAPTVVCEAGSTCHLHCQGGGCDDITCDGGTCHCGSGTCPAGFD